MKTVINAKLLPWEKVSNLHCNSFLFLDDTQTLHVRWGRNVNVGLAKVVKQARVVVELQLSMQTNGATIQKCMNALAFKNSAGGMLS